MTPIMKRTNILLLANSALLLAATACVDLEENPESSTVEQQFYRNENDAISAVNAIYSGLNDSQNNGIYNGLLQIGMDMATDDFEAGPRARNAHVRAISNVNYDAANNRFELLWEYSYSEINRANTAIEHIQEISADNINEATRHRLILEAKFLRALNYFNLIRWFKYIPLVLSETTSLSSETLNVPQADEADIYAQIEKDLVDAEELPAPAEYASTDIGRATAGSAKALLAKVYLTQGKWQQAADKAQEVVNSGWYDLFDDFADVFNTATKNGKEHIFSIQFKGNANFIGNYLACRSAPTTTEVPGVGGDTSDAPHLEGGLVDSYDAEDQRLPVTFISELVSPQDGLTYHLTVPHMHKYYDPTTPSAPQQSSVNVPYIRYAEVLLILAEAINEVDGPTAAAYEPIDKVRARAGIKSLSELSPSLSKDDFREAVFEERRKELAYEFQRWFDLTRRGADYYVAKLHAAGKTNAQPKHIRFPIPQRELDLNPNLKQNPDWL